MGQGLSVQVQFRSGNKLSESNFGSMAAPQPESRRELRFCLTGKLVEYACRKAWILYLRVPFFTEVAKSVCEVLK